jgi:hypothetical protein
MIDLYNHGPGHITQRLVFLYRPKVEKALITHRSNFHKCYIRPVGIIIAKESWAFIKIIGNI